MICSLLSNELTNFSGRYYVLTNARCNPKPVQARLPIAIGGKGPKRTLPTVARWADHWDTTATDVVQWKVLSDVLDGECAAIGRQPAEIRRSDGSRTAVITANLEGDRDLGSVSRDIESVLERLEMPLGFDWKLGGQRQEMQTSFDSMQLAALLAVFMVYLVMASQFESLLHPFVILFSVPYAAIGVLVTLWLFDVTISVVVMIATVVDLWLARGS